MKAYRVIAGIGVILLLTSLVLPWVTLYRQGGGEESLRLIDLYNALFNYLLNRPNSSTLIDFIFSNQLILVSIILYSTSIILALASIGYHKLNLYTGVLCSTSSLLWIVSIDLSKFSLLESLNISETSLASIGYGLYAAILISLIFFTAFFLDERVVKRSQFNLRISKLEAGIKSLDDKIGRLSANVTDVREAVDRQSATLKEMAEEYERLYSSLIRCKVENSYTIDDKLIMELRNIGSLPISWIQIIDVDPRPRNANLPSEKIKLQSEVASGESTKITFSLRDIYGKAIIFDTLQNYTVKIFVGGYDPEISHEVVFKVYGGHLRAEVESVYAEGGELILNIKNVGLLPITQERIVSITPYPGMFSVPSQSQLINSGETKTIKFSLVDGTFVPGLLYTVGLELSDGINTFTLRFSFVP